MSGVVCPDCGDEIPSEHGLKIHRGKRHAAAGGGGAGRAPAGTPAPARPQLVATDELDADSPFAEPVSDAETPPRREAPPWRERLWGAPDGAKKPRPAAPSRERRPRRRRVSTETIWATAWSGAGLALIRSGADIPVGNCLQFQAPVVGPIMDDAIAGTWFDRVLLQPLAGSGEKLKKVGTVVGMPVLVFGIQRAPADMVPMLETMLREMIRENLVEMAKVAKARQKQDEQYRKALADLGMEPGAGHDPVDDVIDAILGGRPPAAPGPTTNGAGPEPQPSYAAAG